MTNKRVLAIATREECAALSYAHAAKKIMAEVVDMGNPIHIGMLATEAFDAHDNLFEEILKSHCLPADDDYSIDTVTGEITLIDDSDFNASIGDILDRLNRDI
jgi:hypothetical protein